jgi:hypothetical protein
VAAVWAELDVDLQLLCWDLFEMARAGKAGSEVVKRQAAAERGDRPAAPIA